MGLDPTPKRFEREHGEFTMAFAKAAALQDRTGLAASDLHLHLRAHIAREEQAGLTLASVHFVHREGAPSDATPLDKARVTAALKALEGFHEEHVALRAQVERVKVCAADERHPEIVDLCRRLLGHIALEDGLVHRLSMVEARAFLSVARGPAAP